MVRIKSLDGIRAVSIVMVLLGHGKETIDPKYTDNFIFNVISNSSLGVMIFFVISGYLITSLLLKEKEVHGKISIKNFYIRRIFRIFPIFYLYIITILILKNIGYHSIFTDYSTVLFAGLYLWNYKHFFQIPETNGNWFFGHTWSLSLEEQFYLIWPFLFSRFNINNLKKVTIGIILISPFLGLITYFILPNSRGQIGMMLPTGSGTIFMGCLGAILEKEIDFKKKLISLLNNKALVFLGFLFVFIINPFLSNKFGGGYSILFGNSLNSAIIMFLIFYCIYVTSLVSTFLNKKLLVKIGLISYSLYIWQQLFLTDLINLPINRFPINLVMCFVVAIISYHFIEKPINNLKTRFKLIK
ncbi:acyltransferase [Flavobacterium sp. 120]|uniref:acyltransferase family protein n=1 Tax=Flavobacterium sp. 120 TaxID=2135626 RepID=UPI000EB11827|nr:acyltransferase [Flavobacterium sp. 120]RKS13293.1 peptidoglycan/LPS O-acetylase OafA/YrhL [Flavobacterium sp. 120]